MTNDAGVSLAAIDSIGGVRCGGCGKTEIGDDWFTIDVECSAGQRDRGFSVVPTITRGFLLCPSCYLSPASGTLRNAVSDVYSVPAPKDYACVTLCVKPHRAWIRGRRMGTTRRKYAQCPGCFRPSRVYRINRDLTPGLVARLSLALTRGKRERSKV